jgi:hypothetical protein
VRERGRKRERERESARKRERERETKRARDREREREREGGRAGWSERDDLVISLVIQGTHGRVTKYFKCLSEHFELRLCLFHRILPQAHHLLWRVTERERGSGGGKRQRLRANERECVCVRVCV